MLLAQARVLDDRLDRLDALGEKGGLEGFELCAGKGRLEVDAVDKALDLDLGRGGGGELPLGAESGCSTEGFALQKF